MKTIREIDLKGKKVLVRADFNVPLDAGLNITDDNRIRAVLPTMTYILDRGAALILCSHLGRPKGIDKTKSLAPVAKRLGELLGREVKLAPDCLGPEVERMAKALPPGQVLLLENLRFQPGESKNDQAMGRELAGLGDVYVNDAFATAHRAHASNVAVARFAQVKAAGFLLENEITYFNRALVNPARPVAAIVGGAKIDTKIGALENLIKSVDKLLIGGAMANTFLKSQGHEVGGSLCQPELAPIAACILKLAAEHGVKVHLPVDAVAAQAPQAGAAVKCVPVSEVPAGWFIMDVGPATALLFGEAVQDAKTIVWNGPVGAFEMDPFSRGTSALAASLAASHALTIVGGGDTDLAVHRSGLADRMSYISTAGGAFLALLEGAALPGVLALEDRFEEIDAPKPRSQCAPDLPKGKSED